MSPSSFDRNPPQRSFTSDVFGSQDLGPSPAGTWSSQPSTQPATSSDFRFSHSAITSATSFGSGLSSGNRKRPSDSTNPRPLKIPRTVSDVLPRAAPPGINRGPDFSLEETNVLRPPPIENDIIPPTEDPALDPALDNPIPLLATPVDATPPAFSFLSKISAAHKYHIIAHDTTVQAEMDKRLLGLGVQYEILRGITVERWKWENVTPEKLDQLVGSNADAAHKVEAVIGEKGARPSIRNQEM